MQTVYLKLTNRCNLNCKHCYNKIAYSHGIDMSDEVLVKSLDFIFCKAQELYKDQLNVVLHGGEPMLYDITKFQYIISHLLCCSNVVLSITTNLVYKLNDKIIDVFKHCSNGLNCSIATSWDYQIRFSNQQEEQLWEKNVKTLISQNIDVQPIVCVSKQLIDNMTPDELFSKLSSLGIRTVNLERLTLTGRATENNVKPTNREVDNWMYEAYAVKDKYQMKVPIIDALIESFASSSLLGCRCRNCTNSVRTINPDGTIAMCPNTADIIVSDIYGNSYADIAAIECNKEKYKRTECYICEYCQYCNGECYQLDVDCTGCPGCIKIMNDLLDKKQKGNL